MKPAVLPEACPCGSGLRYAVCCGRRHGGAEFAPTAEALMRLDPEARLVAQRNEWNQDAWGMTPALRAQFEILRTVPTGGGEILLLRKRR